MGIIIGVTGGIACYKAIQLAKRLINHDIEFILTRSAEKLISKKEFKKIANTHTELFHNGWNYKDYLSRQKTEHISLADKADLFVIFPATANIIGKIANGIADDLLSTSIMATNAPKLICPAMNCKMWKNEIVQENVSKLKRLGYHFIEPESGRLACGYDGIGRLADTSVAAEAIEKLLEKDLKGKKLIVTAGPTIEEIDPVRVLSNKSSGKMGYSIAEQAALRGADVRLISGPTSLPIPGNVDFTAVNSSNEMRKEILRTYDRADAVVMAAAVADFKPVKEKRKIKKRDTLTFRLRKNIDILGELGEKKKKQVLAGFALETENLVRNAKNKMKAKNLDLIIANKAETLSADRSDFVLIKKGQIRKFRNISKRQIADKILDELK